LAVPSVRLKKTATVTVKHTAHLRVKSEAIEPFRERLSRHAMTSLVNENGCRQFDVYQDRSDITLFLLIETYESEAAFELHRTSAHYKAFRTDVAEWVTERNWWYWEVVAQPTKS
jgi:autoinducer 2-degrading protein